MFARQLSVNNAGRSKVSAEADFITRCLGDGGANDREELSRLVSLVSDWKRVVELSKFNGVAPWMMILLDKSDGSISVPASAKNEIKIAAYMDIAKISRLRIALCEILRAIHQHELKVIVLKGAALASLAYEDPTLRPTEDIDLLCEEESFGAIRDILISLGYEQDEKDIARDNCLPLETRFEHHFHHPDGIATIELHVDSLKLGVKPKHSAAIWHRARAIETEGVPALTLSLEDQVVMLSVHLHRHGFNRLIWFKDIDLLVRRYQSELDWNLVISEAKREGAESSLWYTFSMLEKMFGTPIPNNMMSEFRPNIVKRWVIFRIWPESAVLNLTSQTRRRAVQFNISESLRGVVPSLILMNRRREKLGVLLRHILPSRTPVK